MATKLYVGNLPFQISENELKSTFAQVGEVVAVNIITDKFTGKSRGFGFVEMATQELADQAVEKLNGFQLGGRPLVVNEARPMTKEGPGGRRDYGGREGGRSHREGGYKRDTRY